MKKLSLILLPFVMVLSVVGAMVWPAEPVAAACPAGQSPGDRALGLNPGYCYSFPPASCPAGQFRGGSGGASPDANKCYSERRNVATPGDRVIVVEGDVIPSQPQQHGPVSSSNNSGNNSGGSGNSGNNSGGSGNSGGGAPAGSRSGECGGVKVAFLTCTTDTTGDAVQDSALWAILQMVLNIMIGLVGIAAVGGLVYAAIIYSSAQDNASQVQQAKDTIRNVVIGIVMFMFMWAALQYLIPGGIFSQSP